MLDTLYCDEERLRQERGGGTIVLIGIVDIVGVELDLAVVELEVRRVVEVAIGGRIIAVRPSISTKP